MGVQRRGPPPTRLVDHACAICTNSVDDISLEFEVPCMFLQWEQFSEDEFGVTWNQDARGAWGMGAEGRFGGPPVPEIINKRTILKKTSGEKNTIRWFASPDHM